MPPVYIYGLMDPRNQAMRYVGSTKNLETRIAVLFAQPHSAALKEWLTELQLSGGKPILQILEEVEPEIRALRESYWIRYFQSEGLLLNRYSEAIDPFKHGEPTVDTPLKRRRLEMGVTQRELAQRCQVKLRTYQGYEQGRYIPGYRQIEAIMRETGLEAEAVLFPERYLQTHPTFLEEYADRASGMGRSPGTTS